MIDEELFTVVGTAKIRRRMKEACVALELIQEDIKAALPPKVRRACWLSVSLSTRRICFVACRSMFEVPWRVKDRQDVRDFLGFACAAYSQKELNLYRVPKDLGCLAAAQAAHALFVPPERRGAGY